MLVLRHLRRPATFSLITASVVLLLCLSSGFAARRWSLPDRPPLPRNYWEVSDFGVHRYGFAGTGLSGEPVVSFETIRGLATPAFPLESAWAASRTATR
jgi:hypothetical protein